MELRRIFAHACVLSICLAVVASLNPALGAGEYYLVQQLLAISTPEDPLRMVVVPALELNDVSGFSDAGGVAVIDPGLWNEEVIGYATADFEANRLRGIVRYEPEPHQQGALVEPVVDMYNLPETPVPIPGCEEGCEFLPAPPCQDLPPGIYNPNQCTGIPPEDDPPADPPVTLEDVGITSLACQAKTGSPENELGDCGGWWHRHDNYPSKPNGLRAIQKVFGKPCGAAASARKDEFWWASDTGKPWTLTFHRKLGGDSSSNLDYDVYGHTYWEDKAKRRKATRSGMWGYHCRVISGTNSFSTHSWGIAFDISASWEHYGHNDHWCHVVKVGSGVPGSVWQNHGYTWGRDFPRRDCMHFQYASGY